MDLISKLSFRGTADSRANKKKIKHNNKNVKANIGLSDNILHKKMGNFRVHF